MKTVQVISKQEVKELIEQAVKKNNKYLEKQLEKLRLKLIDLENING